MLLKPMKYEDIKLRTGFSESTLSRLANDKYMQTHFGNFKIRKLFTKSIANQAGEHISSDSIRNIITELINNEDSLLPLTDQEIQNKLNEQGITLSRRTITKYRQQIGLKSAGKRKIK
jgi:RNA polymerase sigma-54 factor